MAFTSVAEPWRRSCRVCGLVIALMFIGLAIANPSLWAEAPRLSGTVDYAKSGNTLELLDELTPEIPVMLIRLEGIQAPDLDQKPWGETARECLADLRNQAVWIETNDPQPDQYGRLWGYVWAGKTLVNRTILEQGCGYLSGDRLTHGQHYQELLYAQELARLLGRGIWSTDNPLRETPETFRRRSHSP